MGRKKQKRRAKAHRQAGGEIQVMRAYWRPGLLGAIARAWYITGWPMVLPPLFVVLPMAAVVRSPSFWVWGAMIATMWSAIFLIALCVSWRAPE